MQPDSFRAFVAQSRAEGFPMPPLLLNGIRCLPFHPVGQAEELAQAGEAARKVVGRNRQAAVESGLDEDRIVGEYESGGRIDDADDTFYFRFLYAFWRLCEQRIAVLEDVPSNHAARVVAQRVGMSPDVRVVRLRQRESQTSESPVNRDWKHRWVVRMHKVRQWYPSKGRHKVIYRGPYIKGPDDKPLLGGETVQALIR